MDENTKKLAYLAIDENIDDTTARQVVRYVMECEIWGQDIIAPSRGYLAKKYDWTQSTEDSAIKRAKKSSFITTTGYGKTRCFELNVGFLKGKIAEIVGRNTRPKMAINDLLPPTSPQTLPPRIPPTLPPTLESKYGLTEPYNRQNYLDNNSNNNNSDITKQVREDILEIDSDLGFPLPEDWENNCYYSEDRRIVSFTCNGVEVKSSEITKARKEYEQNLKNKVSSAKRKETMNEHASELINILMEEQEISKLDGGENYKHANSVKTAFCEHLVRDKGFVPEEALTALSGQFRAFLGAVRNKSEFHWNNMTSMGYLARNFNKIVRELK